MEKKRIGSLDQQAAYELKGWSGDSFIVSMKQPLKMIWFDF